MCTQNIVNAQYTLITAGRFQVSSRPIQLPGLEAWLCGMILSCLETAAKLVLWVLLPSSPSCLLHSVDFGVQASISPIHRTSWPSIFYSNITAILTFLKRGNWGREIAECCWEWVMDWDTGSESIPFWDLPSPLNTAFSLVRFAEDWPSMGEGVTWGP